MAVNVAPAPPPSPKPDAYARAIRRVYVSAEARLLAVIAKHLAMGLELSDWEARTLARLRRVRKLLEGEAANLTPLPPAIEAAVAAAYDEGVAKAVSDLKAAELLIPDFKRPTSVGSGVKALAAKVTQNLEQAHFQMVRDASDAFRDIIVEVVQVTQGGGITRRQACQDALNRFADAGVTGFRDVSGRNWDLATYAEMATRTTMAHAAVEGQLQTMTANGYDLVVCSSHSEPCPICYEWEGVVLSITGQAKGYKRVEQALEDGLFHPNCTHTLSPWIPGLSRPMTTRIPQTLEGGYEARQKQRYIERQIRKWKRREAVAISDKDRAFAKAKTREWQGKMREFISETGRRRDRAREQLGAAR